jgi:hypothetical protein
MSGWSAAGGVVGKPLPGRRSGRRRPTTGDDEESTGDDEESAAACGQACPRSAAGAPSERGSDAPIMHIMSTNSARDRFPGWFLTR